MEAGNKSDGDCDEHRLAGRLTEDGPWCIITGETGLAHTRAVGDVSAAQETRGVARGGKPGSRM